MSTRKFVRDSKVNDLSDTIAIYYTTDSTAGLKCVKSMWDDCDPVKAYSYARMGDVYVGQILTSDVAMLYDIVENHDFYINNREHFKINNFVKLEDLVPDDSDQAYAHLTKVEKALA